MSPENHSYTASLDIGSFPENTSSLGSVFQTGGNAIGRALYKKRNLAGRLYPYALFAFDVLLIVGMYALSFELRYDEGALDVFSRRILLVLAVSNFIGVYLIGGYDYQTDCTKIRFACEHAIVSVGVALWAFFSVFVIIAFGSNAMNPGRSTVLFPLIAFPICSILYRFILGHCKAKLKQSTAVCIIGSGRRAKDLYRRISSRMEAQDIFVMDMGSEKTGERLLPEDKASPVIEGLESADIDSKIRGKFVESIIVAKSFDLIPSEFTKRLAASQFNGNKVYTYETFLTQVLRINPHSELSDSWAFSSGFRLNQRMSYDRIKRASDILSAIFGLVVFSPIMLVVAATIKLTSKGPVIFKQIRVGEKEEPFVLYKFRSMKVGSEFGAKYTAANDDRVTRVGKFIRMTRLDELPQLWNVLKGELSLIGPRAEWVELVEEYEKQLPYYHFRHAIKPGITGWAQVNYQYGESNKDASEKLQYDLYYVRQYSLTLDMTIFIKTIYWMLRGGGR